MPVGLARRVGKDTWKTPMAAKSRKQAGRRRQSAGRENPPVAQGESVVDPPAMQPYLVSRV